jgi:hypothetical protein
MATTLERYLKLANELFDKKDTDSLPRGGEYEYQRKMGKLWTKLSQEEQQKIEKWAQERLVIATKGHIKGVKHLLECNCTLPQYRDRAHRVFHKFMVFSIIDEEDKVISKYAQCNNCAIIHKVIEIGKSEFTSKDESRALLTIEDVKRGIPPDVIEILDDHKLEIPYWEEVAFLYEHKRWNSHIVITSEEESGETINKLIRILGPASVRIETVTSPNTIF